MKGFSTEKLAEDTGAKAALHCHCARAAVTCTHLVSFVEEQAEVGKDHPELLPAVTVLELPQQVS